MRLDEKVAINFRRRHFAKTREIINMPSYKYIKKTINGQGRNEIAGGKLRTSY